MRDEPRDRALWGKRERDDERLAGWSVPVCVFLAPVCGLNPFLS